MRLKKWTIYGNIGNTSYPSKYDYSSTLTYPNGTSFETNTGEGERWLGESKYGGQNYKLGADYYINDKNIVGFVWRMSGSHSGSDGNSYTRIIQNSIVDSSYNSAQNSDYTFSYNMFNINYKHIFDSVGTELNVDFDYSYNKNPSESDNTISYYIGNFATLNRAESIEYNNLYKANIYSAKADFEHPFSKKMNMTAGAKFSYVVNDNNKEGLNNGIIDFERTNDFTYDENISALYAGLNVNFTQNTSLRMGLRGEYTQTKGALESPDTTSTHSYFDLFPNLTLRQQLGKNNSLDFAYRYRIQRPDYSSLNPFLYRNDRYSYSEGNPDLKPQYSHSLVLSYALMNMIFVSADYAYSKDQFRYINYYNSSAFISISRPQNIGTNNSLWLSLSGSIPITKWWYFSLYGGCGWSSSEFTYTDSLVRNNVFNSSIWIGQYFTITKNLTAELSGWGRPKVENDDFSSNRGTFAINAGVRHTFFERKLSVRLSVNDIFNTASTWKAEYNYPTGITSRRQSKWGSRSLWITANFQFGKQDIQIRQRKTASEDEQSRTGSGSSNTGGGTGKK